MKVNTGESGPMRDTHDSKEIQLTTGRSGHCLNSTQCFSPDGKMIVYDGRNDDSLLAANGEVYLLDLTTGQEKLIYRTEHQSAFGPGAGAATFSPDGTMVLFLGGIQNCNKERPYSFTRRTGIGVELKRPMIPAWMDARDITPPFTPGALRGGTHAHTWSGDGKWISFTYNDHILAEASARGEQVTDTRTVGIMFPGKVKVKNADGVEEKDGRMHAVLVSRVVQCPKPGSDEVAKAFDECWIGLNGYKKTDGDWQKRAIAFQGHLVDKDGKLKTEIFVADIPENLPELAVRFPSAGTPSTLPEIPPGIVQRRISFSKKGVSSIPRHWLRSVPDGSLIGFLAEDEQGIVQLWGISPNGGKLRQLTFLPTSISSPFNFSPDGKWVAYMSDERVFITRLSDAKTLELTKKRKEKLAGAVVWSPQGDAVIYNRYTSEGDDVLLQVFMVKIELKNE